MESRRVDLQKKIKEVNQEIKSLHSIISDFDMPTFNPFLKVLYEEKFGKDRTAEYEKVNETLESVRAEVQKIMGKMGLVASDSSDAILYFASGMSGLGACGELSYTLMAKLLRAGYPYVSIACLHGGKNHSVLICSSLDFPMSKGDTDFKEIPEGFLLIDPLLNLIIDAKTCRSHPVFGEYTKEMKLNGVITLSQDNLQQMESVFATAKKISDQVKKSLATDAKKSDKIIQQFEKISISTSVFKPTGKEITDQLNVLTGKDWKYYPPKKTTDQAKVLYQSADKNVIDEMVKFLNEEDKDKIQKVKRQIIPGSNPVMHVAVITNPHLASLQKMKKLTAASKPGIS